MERDREARVSGRLEKVVSPALCCRSFREAACMSSAQQDGGCRAREKRGVNHAEYCNWAALTGAGVESRGAAALVVVGPAPSRCTWLAHSNFGRHFHVRGEPKSAAKTRDKHVSRTPQIRDTKAVLIGGPAACQSWRGGPSSEGATNPGADPFPLGALHSFAAPADRPTI